MRGKGSHAIFILGTLQTIGFFCIKKVLSFGCRLGCSHVQWRPIVFSLILFTFSARLFSFFVDCNYAFLSLPLMFIYLFFRTSSISFSDLSLARMVHQFFSLSFFQPITLKHSTFMYLWKYISMCSALQNLATKAFLWVHVSITLMN